MKIIRTAEQVFGPFNSVEILADRFLADGIEMQFSVIGIGEVEEQGDWLPPSPPVPVPSSVNPRQIRQALTAVGLRRAVEAAIAAASQDMQDWYEFATEFERAHPLVQVMAASLGVTDAQLDDIWRLAATL